MMLGKKIKNFVARFQTSEFDRFRYRYSSLPRYTPCKINFRSFSFETLDATSVIWQIKETFFDEQEVDSIARYSKLLPWNRSDLGLQILKSVPLPKIGLWSYGSFESPEERRKKNPKK